MAQRGKRLKFFTLTIINHFIGFLLSLFFKLKVLPLYILCYFTVTLTILVITLKWKISVHTAGVAGPRDICSFVFRFCLLTAISAFNSCGLGEVEDEGAHVGSGNTRCSSCGTRNFFNCKMFRDWN